MSAINVLANWVCFVKISKSHFAVFVAEKFVSSLAIRKLEKTLATIMTYSHPPISVVNLAKVQFAMQPVDASPNPVNSAYDFIFCDLYFVRIVTEEQVSSKCHTSKNTISIRGLYLKNMVSIKGPYLKTWFP